MIPPKPSKYICKNCKYSIVIVHGSDFLTEHDLPPIKCPKCKQNAGYTHIKANKKDLFFYKIFKLFK